MVDQLRESFQEFVLWKARENIIDLYNFEDMRQNFIRKVEKIRLYDCKQFVNSVILVMKLSYKGSHPHRPFSLNHVKGI